MEYKDKVWKESEEFNNTNTCYIFPLLLSNEHHTFVQLCELRFIHIHILPHPWVCWYKLKMIRKGLSQSSTWAIDIPREAIEDISTY